MKINEEKKTILFHKEFKLGEEPLKTVEYDLISGYVCPKCKQILLAYFKTDEFIPVWKYDEKNKDKHYKSSNFLKYYRYKVFYASCGLMGIELKDHNNNYSGCSYKISKGYNTISSVNIIINEIEDEINSHYMDDIKEIVIKKLPNSFDKKLLLNNLVNCNDIKLIEGICKNDDPLIKLSTDIKYDKIETCGLKYNSPEKKAAKLSNYNNKKKRYMLIIEQIKHK